MLLGNSSGSLPLCPGRDLHDDGTVGVQNIGRRLVAILSREFQSYTINPRRKDARRDRHTYCNVNNLRFLMLRRFASPHNLTPAEHLPSTSTPPGSKLVHQLFESPIRLYFETVVHMEIQGISNVPPAYAESFLGPFVMYYGTQVRLIPEYAEGLVEHHVDALECSWQATRLARMRVGMLTVKTERSSCEGVSGLTHVFSIFDLTYHPP